MRHFEPFSMKHGSADIKVVNYHHEHFRLAFPDYDCKALMVITGVGSAKCSIVLYMYPLSVTVVCC